MKHYFLLLKICYVRMEEDAAVEPMSNNTIQCRISDLTSDVRKQWLDGVRESPVFFAQLDESTDVANYAQLMVYVRKLTSLVYRSSFCFVILLPATHTMILAI